MIYITEFGASLAAISHIRAMVGGERLNGAPKAHMLAISIFQVSDSLYTGTEIKHDIICRYHSITQSNNF